MIDLDQLRHIRDEAIHTFNPWKAEISLVDRIAAGDWSIMWPDRSKEKSKPLVENIYVQALEDKMAAAGSILPSLFVPPKLGTRADRAEAQAQKRRRIMISYWDNSRLRRGLKAYARDWLHTGACYSMPWTAWKHFDGTPTMPNERFPFLIRIDPRQAYPVAHTPNGDLATVLVMRTRRVADVRAEWGEDHPALQRISQARAIRGTGELGWVEEIWYYDQTQWAVAVVDHNLPSVMQQGSTFMPQPKFGTPVSEWLVPPETHMLFGCPITEAKRTPTESDDGYKSALIDIVAPLEVAQNFRARLLDDLDFSIYAPVVLDNIQNPEEYGPGATLVGTGDGEARVLRDRAPVNFEADRTVTQILDGVRRDAFEPPQRSGTFGASIASAKGVNAVQGTWNAELAWVQGDLEWLLARSTAMAACFDEKWCYGTKQVMGWDDRKRPYRETYSPVDVFGGDYRVEVSYGDRTGLDEQNHMVKLATELQLGAISKRTFMARSSTVEDPLQEERDIALEKLTTLFIDGVLPQQIQSGDLRGFAAMVEAIDNDDMLIRAAAMKVARELGMIPPADGSGVVPGPDPATPDGAAVAASLGAGGIPGSAEGLPVPGRELRRVLPSGVQRRIQEAV